VDPLVTAEELADYCRRPLDVAGDGLAVALASGLARLYCGWSISSEQATFVLDGNGTRILSLPTLLLLGVDEVIVNGVVIVAAADDAEAGYDEYTWSANGQLTRWCGWPYRMRGITVKCAHGYDDTPDAVRAVVFALGADIAGNPEGLISKTVGQVSRTYATKAITQRLTGLQLAQLDGYRLP